MIDNKLGRPVYASRSHSEAIKTLEWLKRTHINSFEWKEVRTNEGSRATILMAKGEIEPVLVDIESIVPKKKRNHAVRLILFGTMFMLTGAVFYGVAA